MAYGYGLWLLTIIDLGRIAKYEYEYENKKSISH